MILLPSPVSDCILLGLFFPFRKAPWRTRSARLRRLLRIAFYAASALVAGLSLVPSATLPPTSIGDKMEHAIAYAVLGLLGAASSARGVTRTILGLAAFGLIIEALQTFSPGRSPDLLDAATDVIGAGLGCAAAIVLRRMTWLLIDKGTAGATPCRARVAGGDIQATCGSSAAAPSSSNKRASCVSN
ncbi:MAG TPA: VanZ family protein [Dongiaceae bacterium]|nr:VanZ family protein [Dongiaceae bacterium]